MTSLFLPSQTGQSGNAMGNCPSQNRCLSCGRFCSRLPVLAFLKAPFCESCERPLLSAASVNTVEEK